MSTHTVPALPAILLAFAATQTQAAAPAFPSYPNARTTAAVGDWIRKQTDLPQTSVIGIGPDSVFAIEPASTAAAAPYRRTVVRQEAIGPSFAQRLGGRSAVMTVDVDCAGHRVFQRALQLYVGSNRQGAVRQLGAGEDWRDVPADSFMAKVQSAVCETGQRPPLAPEMVTVTADAAAATPRPVPTPTSTSTSIKVSAPLPTRSPAPIGAGRVNLGQFESADAAIQAWSALATAYPKPLAGKRPRVELAVTGGQTRFHGEIEGFADHAEAEAFCTAAAYASAVAGHPCQPD